MKNIAMALRRYLYWPTKNAVRSLRRRLYYFLHADQVVNLVKEQHRMADGWAESDKGGKGQLWTRLHAAGAKLEQVTYPL